MMSGSTSSARVDRFTAWTLNSNVTKVWYTTWGGTSDYSDSTDTRGVRPVIDLSPVVKIKSGNGTATSPYVLEY